MTSPKPAAGPNRKPERRWPFRSRRPLWLLVIVAALLAAMLGLAPHGERPTGTGTALAAEGIDTATLRRLDGLTRVTLSSFRYNRVTGSFLGSATLTNTSGETLTGPLYLVVESLTPAGATIVGATGITAAGQPYVNITSLLTGGTLAPGRAAKPANFTIAVPTVAPVDLRLRAYGPPVQINRPPQANAGPDQTAYVGQTLTLDGSRSVDPDGDSLRFSWSLSSKPSGSSAQLTGPALVNPSFPVDRLGDYIVRLIVNDGSLDSAPDTVTVSTLNSRPTANAGANQTARVGDLIALDGSGSTDVDRQTLTYHWTLAAPAGSTAALDNDRSVAPHLQIDRRGTYTATLIVNDGFLDSAPASVAIDTENSAPRACIAADRPVFVGDTVHLDGSCSTDPDGDPLTYAWSLTPPTGSTASIHPTTTVAADFDLDLPGTYVVQLSDDAKTNKTSYENDPVGSMI